MRFGKTLRESAYPPWKDAYIDYTKLKRLLRDYEDKGSDSEGGESVWTEADENRFCDEVFNVQLEKVASFQESRVHELRERTDATFEKLKYVTPEDAADAADASDAPDAPAATAEPVLEAAAAEDKDAQKSEITVQRVREIEAELDSITNEIRELKRYSSLNYTGFLKIVKKHDRKRGNHYRIRPMMQVSLARRPFNSEASYSPLLAKLSLMYAAVHQYLNPDEAHPLGLETDTEAVNGGVYTAHKFWVHPDNLLEVKTMVLRHLPALVYSDSSAKEADATVDPTLTSLYFDNSKFELYNHKLDPGDDEAASLRLRWYGQLAAKPDIFLDQKIVRKDGTSEERRIAIKDKYIKPFLDGKYHMEKSVQKMERQGERPDDVAAFRERAAAIQEFVRQKHLEPVLRANFVRTAFQKPADDRVRVSIDTSLAFIREDNLDGRRLTREEGEWHRRDMDAGNIAYPFTSLPPSDVSRFPYAVLEIKLREDASGNGRKRAAWVEDLMASHLVHAAPHFSKFVHGAAVLFDDYVNRFPFWLSDLERDIRRDPQEAFAEEELRRAQRAADEQAVGSLLGTTGKQSSYKPARSSPAIKSASYLADKLAAETAIARRAAVPHDELSGAAASGSGTARNGATSYGTISSVLPSFSMTRYAKWRREKDQGPTLPEGVTEPTEWLKNAGPLRIEPKVWLANERTFLKWQHIAILLGSLAVALFTAAGSQGSGGQHGGSNTVAAAMGIVYTAVAVFAGFWGWFMLQTRRDMIMARSGRDFDNMIGPVVVSLALIVALLLNLGFAYRAAFDRWAAIPTPVGNASEAFVHA